MSTSRKSKPPLVPKGNAIPSNTDNTGGGGSSTGQTSGPDFGPHPAGIGSASGGGGASSRHGDLKVPKNGPRSKGDENDRTSRIGGSIFYKISYNLYG